MREVGNVEGFQEALSITVGKVEGDEGVGDHVGLTVGEMVGWEVGVKVGRSDSVCDGSLVGCAVSSIGEG